jgi:6-pyruvoyltetrahydropterin/6-carboxytetrahydropterin synthase
MYTVSAQAHYDAAHYLRFHEGKCRQLHGHRYVIEAAVQSETLNEAGLAFDFGDLKGILRALAEDLDHQNLNDLPQFQGIETSAENQARYFYDALKERLPPELAQGLLYTRVWESPNQWAQYGPVPTHHPAFRAPSLF